MHPPENQPAAAALRRLLLEHYDRSRRDLPWRGEADPYRIWVSEVMLQQTRVETVIPYYRRWLERFPDVRALADAAEDEVLEAWEGLGYYSRARNLQTAARLLRDRYGGALPATVAELQRLPGFGSYTAGAVASIAFGVVSHAVDGNVRRVLSRVYDLVDPSSRDLQNLAAELVDPSRPGDFNQALMELGATVCTPRSPRCGECPLGTLCVARARGTVAVRPQRAARRVVPRRSFAVAVIARDDGHVLLVRRPRRGLLAGMWSFPEVETQAGTDPGPSAEALARALGFEPTAPQPLPPVDHAFTHLYASYLPVLLSAGGEGARERAQDTRWVAPSTPGVALPTAQKRILAAAASWLAPGAKV